MTIAFTSADNDLLSNATFSEALKNLAKSYYPFVYSDKRNLSRLIVDLQASFEVAFDALDDIERTSGDVEGLHYAIYGLEEALSRALTELVVIRDEVHSLTVALKQSEQFNLKLYDQLVSLDHEATDGIESSRQTLNASRCMTNKYRIPQTTKEALDRAWLRDNSEKSHGDVNISSFLSSQRDSHGFHTWICRIQRELSHRHSEFSFLTMGLWTEEVCSNLRLAEPQSAHRGVGCFSRRNRRAADFNENVTKRREVALKSLLLTRHVRMDDTPSALGSIQSKVQELGDEIFAELRRRREILEEARSLHRALNEQLGGRRHQLVESLLATHQAVQTLLDMDEQNDGLVGKLIKTRPLFAELQEAVVRSGGGGGSEYASGGGRGGNGGVGGVGVDAAPFQALPEVLGAEGWRELLEKLRAVRLGAARTCNASNHTPRVFKYPLPLRSRLRRL